MNRSELIEEIEKYTIYAITHWEEDSHAMNGDASREGVRAVQRLLEEERERKIDNGKWPGLPFECEADNIQDALDAYNETHCEHDYIKAVGCDWDRFKFDNNK